MITFDEFKKTRQKREKERYNHFIWVKEKEQEYNIENVSPRDFNTIILYRNAVFSFINECYLASILTISTTIEQYLLWKELKISKLKKRIFREDTKKIFNKLIPPHLVQEFDKFNERCRDEVAHPKTRSHFSSLGLPYNIEKGYFGSPTAKPIQIPVDSNNLQTKIGFECAKDGLELFMKIVNYDEAENA
ncbi:MAG: hypothetical protein ACTSQK_03940 [Candidatus Heimdallarchaeota archaeon]